MYMLVHGQICAAKGAKVWSEFITHVFAIIVSCVCNVLLVIPRVFVLLQDGVAGKQVQRLPTGLE
jgi:hypothetical protein